MSIELLKLLRESNDFHVIMGEMWRSRPVIPVYTPQATQDLTSNLVERIKYQSAMRQGFDVLYTALAGQLRE